MYRSISLAVGPGAEHECGASGSVIRQTVLSGDRSGIAWVCVSVVFRADGLPLASRVDYWREIISNVFMPLDLRGEIGPKTPAELRTTEIGPIRFTESVTGPGSSFRTGRTPRLIRSSDPDVCLVGVLVDGQLRIEQDGRQAVLRPGDLSFVDRRGRSTSPSPLCATSG